MESLLFLLSLIALVVYTKMSIDEDDKDSQ